MDDITKYCSGCSRDLPLLKFWKNKSTSDGYQAWCKSCWKKITDKRRNGPKRHIELRQRQNRHLIREYGITIEDYEDILKQQNGVCAICGAVQISMKKLAVDHCHKTNVVRGLLCENCNRGLGLFKDNQTSLKRAVEYLDRW